MLSLASLHDTLTGRSHSRDFAQTRSEFLRNRVMVVGIVFLALLPFWSLIDRFALPNDLHPTAMLGRGIMLVGLVLSLALAHYSKGRLQLARLSAGLLLATPSAFYALVLASLPEITGSLVGYTFISYMLVSMLAVFPFTLAESVVLGAILIGLEAYALFAAGNLFSMVGLEAIWLLAALLVIACTANYFQLSLMLRLYREATHDPLTGLLNRGALLRAVNGLELAGRTQPCTVLMLDLDHFKRLNDTHGHTFGDDVLRAFSGILRRELRPTDIIARYGGEEFVAILNDADRNAAVALAETVRQQTEALQLMDYDSRPVRFTVSIGVAEFRQDESFQSALVRADNRLYEAKKISRNCVVAA